MRIKEEQFASSDFADHTPEYADTHPYSMWFPFVSEIRNTYLERGNLVSVKRVQV